MISSSVKDSGASRIKPFWHDVLILFHVIVLIGALCLIVMLTRDTLNNVSLRASHDYMYLQLGVCLLLLADIFFDCYTAKRPLRRFAINIPFIIIAIPWMNIFSWINFQVTGEAEYLMNILPVLRTTYIIAVVSMMLSGNKIAGILTGYISFMVMVAYLGSMLFYVEEHSVNPDITSYPQALWWAVMSMTTAGCYINEYTLTGKVLVTVLSGCGIMFFPVFTVYVTNAIGQKKKTGNNEQNSDTLTQGDSENNS